MFFLGSSASFFLYSQIIFPISVFMMIPLSSVSFSLINPRQDRSLFFDAATGTLFVIDANNSIFSIDANTQAFTHVADIPAGVNQYSQGAYSAGIFYFGLTPSGTNGSCIASLDTTANPAVFTLLACSASQPVPNQPASLALGDGVLLVSDPNRVRLFDPTKNNDYLHRSSLLSLWTKIYSSVSDVFVAIYFRTKHARKMLLSTTCMFFAFPLPIHSLCNISSLPRFSR